MNKTNQFIFDLKEDLKSYYYLMYDFDLIFSNNTLQVDLLNDTASNFFKLIRHMYSIQIVLSISRMVDRSEQFGNKNLSLYGLLEFAKEIDYPHCSELKNRIDEIKSEAETNRIILARSKYIAHRDINYKEISNISVKLKKVKQIFDKMGDCINNVLSFLGEREEGWSVLRTDSQSGALALLNCLKDAMIYREIQAQKKDQSMTPEEASKCKYGDLQFGSDIWTTLIW